MTKVLKGLSRNSPRRANVENVLGRLFAELERLGGETGAKLRA
jgi:hypothetical protein